MRHLAPEQSAELGLLLEFLHVDSHLGCQPTGTGTHSPKSTTAKHSERDLCIARKDFLGKRKRHEHRGPCPHCRRATRSLGSRQGTKDRIVPEPPEAENVTRRDRSHPRRAEGPLGQVEKATEELGRDAAPSFHLPIALANKFAESRSAFRIPTRFGRSWFCSALGRNSKHLGIPLESSKVDG